MPARAIEVAEALAPLNTEPVVLADEPSTRDTYVSSYEIDPFAVPENEKIEFLLGLNERALASELVDRVTSYADPRLRAEVLRVARRIAHHAAARARQGRSHRRAHRQVDRRVRDDGLRGAAGRAGLGVLHAPATTSPKDADEIPALLEQKMASPSVKPGRYDLVIDPTNLWLTIHESIGHSTELDRVLGYEANYAGTSFATLDKLNTLQFGSPIMHVTGDRQVEHGLSTVGYDDEGVAAQTWDIIRDGVLVGYQLDRQMAHKQGFGRSNGCAFADAADHVPLQRMPNVSLQPSPKDITLDDLIGGVDDGIYIVGDKSWSIDMQRYNFQFTGQKFFRIRGGKIVGQLKDVAYQSRTTDFWNAHGGGRRAVDLRARRRVQLRQGAAGPDRAGHARMSGGALPADQRPQHRAGGALIDIQETIDRVLALSKADACIVIGRRDSRGRTSGGRTTPSRPTALATRRRCRSSRSSAGAWRRCTRTHFPPEQLEEMVRESEAACARRPEAPDYMPLLGGVGEPAGLGRAARRRPTSTSSTRSCRSSATLFERARRAGIQTFGYAEHERVDVWLATSTGLRRRHGDRIGKVEITAKTPDFSRSSWVGQATRDFRDVDPRALFDTLEQRLAWSERRIDLPAGHYEVLLEPSCTADLAHRARTTS